MIMWNNSYRTGHSLSTDVVVEPFEDGAFYKVSISVGDEYYESDPYTNPADALNEALGYLDGLQMHLRREHDRVKKLLKELNK